MRGRSSMPAPARRSFETADRGAPNSYHRSVLILVFFVSLVYSKDIYSLERSPKKLLDENSIRKDFLNNQVLQDYDDDDGEFYLGYSGYLRSGTSMLGPQTRFKNFTDNALSKNNSSTHESSKANGNRRVKRGVTHLYNMILCATGCNPLAYKGYGCYCGFLGSGYPMDGIDRCCKMHDWCYDATDCPMFVEYFVPYYWKCYHGYKPVCAIEHGEWGNSGSCAQRLCECDRTFSECLRHYHCPSHKAVCTSSPWRLIQNIFMII